MADNDVQMVFIRRAGSVFQYSVENEKLKEERAVQSYKNLIPGNAGKNTRFIVLLRLYFLHMRVVESCLAIPSFRRKDVLGPVHRFVQ